MTTTTNLPAGLNFDAFRLHPELPAAWRRNGQLTERGWQGWFCYCNEARRSARWGHS